MARKLPLFGITLATPLLTAASEPATARLPQAPATIDSAASATLKAQLLAMNPSEKLAVAGHRLQLAAATTMTTGAVGRTNTDIPECHASSTMAKPKLTPAQTAMCTQTLNKNLRTNTDIPECHAPAGAMTGAGAMGAGAAPRTNTDIPECQAPSGAKSDTLLWPHMHQHAVHSRTAVGRTNTDIPECHAPNGSALKASGATGTGTAPRTNTDIPECHAPNGSALTGSGATGSGSAPRTNTDIPECHSPNGAMTGSGATTTGTVGRTNTDIPECHSPHN